MAKKTLEQKQSVTLLIGTPLAIPWMAQKGVTLVLCAEGKKLGAIRVTGSRVYVRRGGKKIWMCLSFKKCLDRLTKPNLGGNAKKSFVGVSLKDIIDAQLLTAPLNLFVHYKGHDLKAKLLPDGTVSFQGKPYETCSMAADVARGTITGRPMKTNGWHFWKYRNEIGEAVFLDVARREYLKSKAN